jgi:hypothetical protein
MRGERLAQQTLMLLRGDAFFYVFARERDAAAAESLSDARWRRP